MKKSINYKFCFVSTFKYHIRDLVHQYNIKGFNCYNAAIKFNSSKLIVLNISIMNHLFLVPVQFNPLAADG